MAKKLYLHIKWDETKEKNGSKSGDDGVYDIEITEGCEIKLWGHSEKAIVRRLADDEITLIVPNKGEYVFKLNETARISYTRGYQVAGDWVDESLIYDVKLSDMSLSEYERSLPDFEIKDGVLVGSRAKGDVIVVPEGVVEIGHKAFCEAKLKEVILPSTLKKISSFAFSDCRYLKRVTLPDGIESLGFYAFADTGIEDINFPCSLKKIDGAAFRRTPFVEKTGAERFVVLGERFLYLYNGYDDTVEVPKGVEVICSGAFTDRKAEADPYFLTPARIILPDSLKRIEEGAFKYLRGLRAINLRTDMEIAENTFDYSGYEGQFKAFLASKGEPKQRN